MIEGRAHWLLVFGVVARAGTSMADTPAREEGGTPSPAHESFLVVGFGSRFVSKPHSSAESAELIDVELGQRLGNAVHLIEQAVTSSDVSYAASESTFEILSDVSVGIRWTPPLQRRRSASFWGSPFRYTDVAAVFFEGTAGVAIRQREFFNAATGKANATQVGGTGRAGVGWLPMQGDDYAFGFIGRGAVTRYSHETTFEVQFVIVAQLTH